MNLSALFKLSYGMHVIGVNDNGRPTGCIVNTVIQVTSVNPIVSISINKDNYTADVIKNTGKFAVSILSEDTAPKVISALGFACGKDRDKFNNVNYKLAGDSLPIIDDNCSGYLLCDVISTTDAETHIVILARVVDTIDGCDAPPMTYRYYHEVVKGKAPPKAPTYVAPEKKSD